MLVRLLTLLFLSFGLGTAAAAAEAPVNTRFTLHTHPVLKPYEATYEVKKYGMRARIDISLTLDGERFTYVKSTRPKGMARMFLDSAVETSIFTVEGEQIVLHEYLYKLESDKGDRDEYFSSDPDNHTISGSTRGREFSVELEPGLVDRASMEVLLMLDAEKKAPLDYRVLHRGRVKDYEFQYQGKKQLRTRYGDMQCDQFKVVRSSGERSTSLCLSEELGYLPLSVTHEEDGREFVMNLVDQNRIDKLGEKR